MTTTGHGFFRTRLRVLATLGPCFVVAAIALQLSACKGCDITGVFNFCNAEGRHDTIVSPPQAWRDRAADVQQLLYAYVRSHAPADTARFVWRDPARRVWVRVLGPGVPGACARTNGDTTFVNAGDEDNVGIQRHEDIHWIQPGNPALEPGGRIHDAGVFSAGRAPLSC